MAKPTDELVQHVSLYTRRPIPLSGVVLPFVVFYLLAFYVWIFTTQSYEAGLVSVVAVAFVHILTLLACFWSVHVQAFLNCQPTKQPRAGVLAKVVPTPNNGSSKIVPICMTRLVGGSEMLYFIFQKTKYIWDEDKATFRVLDFPVHELMRKYVSSHGLDADAVTQAEQTYGINEMDMVVPEFHELFVERATAPFFVFQVFSVCLWFLDEYWYYSLFTLIMLVLFECTLVQQQLRNMSEIRKMGNKPYQINVLRSNRWRFIASDQLLPGDVVSITRFEKDNIVPCDLVLLRGSCIVDESMLTGESVPQMKESLESLPTHSQNVELDAEGESKLFVLFGGTKVVQHTPAQGGLKAPDGGCIGYVIRNGFNTSQGKLLRTILFGVNRVTENNLETFAFILFLMVFAVAAAVYVWIKGTEDPERNRYKLFLECTLILTSIIPPDLPIELTLAVNSSLIQLSKLYIYCTEPFRIPFAGKVQICCFDKTGTLTSDSLTVEGVAGLTADGNIVPIDQAEEITVKVLASCHSLVMVRDTLVGDPLEKAMLTAVDWNLTKQESAIPKRGNMRPLRIYQRYYFSSALKRMSVLAGYLLPNSNTVNYIATVKGAPEVIQAMLNTVPANYKETYLKYSRRGARVLALGYKDMGQLNAQSVRDLQRDNVESDLIFAGFVIVSCPLKPDSKSVIKELLHASHKVVMITGDNPLTACHVAKELRFTRKKLLVLTSLSDNGEGAALTEEEWLWKTIDGEHSYEIGQMKVSEMLSTYDLCITGEGLRFMDEKQHAYMLQVLPYITVFARFAPKQKEFAITTLKQLGYCTLMCGDGTNDVGALKHAQVGVSLLSNAPLKLKRRRETAVTNANAAANQNSERQHLTPRERALQRHRENMQNTNARVQALINEMDEDQVPLLKLGDASIAAPFTSKESSISCVTHIVKQGRCTLVTTLQMFKILALNALISAYCHSVLYIDNVKFNDIQATLQGIFIALCFLAITRSKPLKMLSKTAPLPNVFNVYTISTILCQFAVHFTALYYLANEAKARTPPTTDLEVQQVKLAMDMTPEEKMEFKPDIINGTVYIICIASQLSTIVVNYKGHPFKESLHQNRFLLTSIIVFTVFIVALSLGFTPVTSLFEIVDFPHDFRLMLIVVLVLDAVLAFVMDKLCAWLFGDTRPDLDIMNTNA